MTDNQKITCLNCQNEFNSEHQYCPHCGQVNRENKLNFKYFVSEFLSANFNLDSKIFTTLKLLIISPATLSRAFLEGKRTQYITPVRLYLIASLIFFFVLSLSTDIEKLDDDSIVRLNMTEGLDSLVSNVSNDTAAVNEKMNRLPIYNNHETVMINDQQIDSLVNQTNEETDGLISESLVPKFKKLNTDSGKKDFFQLLSEYASMGMFVLMPFSALLLFMLFSSKSYYIEHLILSLHLHTLAFLLFTFFNLIEFLISWTYLEAIETSILLILVVLWLKSFYKMGWLKAILKSILFLVLYDILLLLFFLVIAGFSFLNL